MLYKNGIITEVSIYDFIEFDIYTSFSSAYSLIVLSMNNNAIINNYSNRANDTKNAAIR